MTTDKQLTVEAAAKDGHYQIVCRHQFAALNSWYITLTDVENWDWNVNEYRIFVGTREPPMIDEMNDYSVYFCGYTYYFIDNDEQVKKVTNVNFTEFGEQYTSFLKCSKIQVDALYSNETGIIAVKDNLSLEKNFDTYGDITAKKNLNVLGNAELNGGLTVNGQSQFKDNVSFNKEIYVNEGLHLKGEFFNGGNMSISGETELNGGLTVNGQSQFNDNVSFNKEIYVNEGLHLKGGFFNDGNMSISGETELNGVKSQVVHVDEILRYSGSSDIIFYNGILTKDNLTVNNTTTLQGRTTINGQTTVNEDLNVNKNVNVAGYINNIKIRIL